MPLTKASPRRSAAASWWAALLAFAVVAASCAAWLVFAGSSAVVASSTVVAESSEVDSRSSAVTAGSSEVNARMSAAVARSSEVAAGAAPTQSESTADLVVDFDDGRVEVRRVGVGPDTTGMALLERSGLDLTTTGGLVCAIGGVGCPAHDCFCEPDRFWAYHHLEPDNSWRFSEEGAATHVVGAGDVEGWVWSGKRPPVTTTMASRGVAVGHYWLRSQVLADGSFGGHAGLTADGVIAARVAGAPLGGSGAPAGGGAVTVGGSRAVASGPEDGGAAAPIEYLRAEADAYSSIGAASAGKLAVAVAAANRQPTSFGGVNLLLRIYSSYDGDTGRFGSTNWDQAWSILGVAASGYQVPRRASLRLADAAVDGGWGVGEGSEPESDSTGLVLQALIAAGEPVTSTAVAEALGFLDRVQNDDGGWGHGPPGDTQPSNVNSTAFALQGLLAAGQDPLSGRWIGGDGGTPVSFLMRMQLPDGRFEHDTSPADLMATLQALPALAGRSMPLGSAAESVDRATTFIGELSTGDGAYEGYNPGATIDAVFAVAAAGLDPGVPLSSGATPTEYLAAQAGDYAATGPSAAGKLATAVVALGHDPHGFGGVDVVAAISETYHIDGHFGAGGTWDNAWAMLGLAASGERVPAAAVDALVDAATFDGGWGFEAGADEATADSTGLALQALVAAGLDPSSPPVRSGLGALRRMQLPGAGFPGFGGEDSASSMGFALMGLVAAGQDPAGPGWSAGGFGSGAGFARLGPADALMAMQSANGGFAGYSGPEDPAATYQAVPGLARRTLPIRLERLLVPAAMRGE